MAAPNDDVVAVYLAHKADPSRSARSLGQQFGVHHATVRRWIEVARSAEDWVVAFDRAELVTTVHGALAELLADSIEDARGAEDGRERAEHRKVALGAIDRVMRLHGLSAPTRVQFEAVPEPPDPELVAKIREATRRGNAELVAESDPNDTTERF